MKLSICIPIYNTQVEPLVKELLKQGDSLNIDYEICLIDDFSHSAYKEANRKLKGLSRAIKYVELVENVGRSKIRNLLAEMSDGEWLIFLDADVLIHKNDFINTYLENQGNSLVYCGGILYPEKLNTKNHELRYKYGKEVEEIKLINARVNSPFLTGNFMVHQSVFDQLRFDESIKKYGYEDALFAIEFENIFNQEIKYINNPISINHIDTNEEFLLKTKDAAENLGSLYNDGKIVINNNIRLLIAYNQLKENGLLSVINKLGFSLMPMLTFNLLSANPSLKLFQFFKLIHFTNSIANNK